MGRSAAMTRAQRWMVALIVCVPVLVMAALGYLHVRGQARQVFARSEWVVEDAISQQIGRDVRIGKAELSPVGRLVLRDVAIAQGESFSQGVLVRASKVVVTYDHSAILFEGAGASAVSLVEVFEPTAWLSRSPDGVLNISDLFKPRPGPPGPPFLGKVRVIDGTAVFQDYYRSPGVPIATRIRSVSVDVDASGHRRYKFSFSGRDSAGRFRSVRASGVYDSETRNLWLDASAEGVRAAFASRTLGRPMNVAISRGVGDFVGSVSMRLGTRRLVPRINGVARVRGLDARIPGLHPPVQNVSGVVVLGGETAVVDLTGFYAGLRADLKGSVSGWHQPVMDLTVSTDAISVPEFSRAARLPAIPPSVRIRRIQWLYATVTGTLSMPRVEAVAAAPEAIVQGYRVTDVRVSFGYARDTVRVHAVELDFMGARIQASGAVGLSGGYPLEISGRVRGIDLARLPVGLGYDISGVANADLAITGTLRNPVISAEALVRNTRVEDVPLGLVEAGVTISGGGLTIRHARATGFTGGSLSASGTYANENLDVHFSASGVQASSLGRLFGRPGLGGRLYVNGRLEGPLSSPVFTGMVEGFGLRSDGYGAEYARASVAADRNSLEVRSAFVRWHSAEIRLRGSVWQRDPDTLAFQTAGHIERLNLDRVLDMMGSRPDVSGTVGGEFSVTGVYNLAAVEGESPLVETEATGAIRLRDGTAFGYPVDDAVAQWTFRDRVLSISETTIVSEGAGLTLGGSVYVDRREIDFDFGLSGLDLRRVDEYTPDYASILGVANLSGLARGPWDDVRIAVTGGIEGLVLNGLAFDDATLQASLSRSLVDSAQLVLARGAQRYSLSVASYDIVANQLGQGIVQLANVSMTDLQDALRASPYLRTQEGRRIWQMLTRMPRLTGGTLNSTLTMTGTLPDLDGNLMATARDIGFDGQKIDNLEVSASAKGGVVELPSLIATSGETYLQASGHPLYKEGQVQLSLSVNNFDFKRLSPLLADNKLSGVASIELEATGSASSPTVVMSAEVVNPGFGGLVFERLRAPRITVADGRISFPEPDSGIILAAADHQIVTHGYIPWDWSALSIPTDRPLEVTSALNNEDLSILSSFVALVDANRTSGPIEAAAFRVTGTLQAPVYDGIVQIKGGNLALKGFSSEFRNLNVDLAFDGNRLLINSLSAESSLGGTVRVEPGGTLAISGQDTGVNLLLVADELKIAERNAAGLNEDISLQLDAGINITGSLASPLIADAAQRGVAEGIVISNALLKFAVPERTARAAPLKLPINPQFDVSIDIGKNVRLQPPSMSLLVGGGGRVAGKFNDPSNPFDLRLDVTVDSGSLYLAATRLKVMPGSTVEVVYVPPADPAITLRNFRATASVMATSALGQRERYQVTLTASGPVSKMQIDLVSDPPGLSRERMLAALGHAEGLLNASTSGLQGELAAAVTATATSTLFRPIERVFTEQLGFEQFSLDYSPLGPMSIYLSTRLVDSIYVSYFQRLRQKISEQTSKNYELKISWRFRESYEVNVATDDEDVVTFGLGFRRAFH